jgi:hypothetical protein
MTERFYIEDGMLRSSDLQLLSRLTPQRSTNASTAKAHGMHYPD